MCLIHWRHGKNSLADQIGDDNQLVLYSWWFSNKCLVLRRGFSQICIVQLLVAEQGKYLGAHGLCYDINDWSCIVREIDLWLTG